MSIGSDLMVEIAEEEHTETVFQEKICRTAKSIANREGSRINLFKRYDDLVEREQDALAKNEYDEGEDGNIRFWDETLNTQAINTYNPYQITAISNELEEQFSHHR